MHTIFGPFSQNFTVLKPGFMGHGRKQTPIIIYLIKIQKLFKYTNFPNNPPARYMKV